MMIDVLGIAPHPDDLELSAGGTVAGLVQSGHMVVFVDMTEGERGSRGSREIRRREASEASAVLGLAGRENLSLPDGGLDSSNQDQMQSVVDIIRKYSPRLVMAMHENDDHPDHQEAAVLVRRAVYLSGLKNWPNEGSQAHRSGRCVFAMGRRTFEPSFIVDVSSTYEIKLRAMAAFHSQFNRDLSDPNMTPISEPGFLKAHEGRSRHYGSLIGAEFGEPFWTDRPWALSPSGLLQP